jgi:hypothetical protein
MEIKLLTQLSQGNERRLKILPYHLMEGNWGYNRLSHTMLQHDYFDLENRVLKFLKMKNCNFYHVNAV